MVNLPNRPHVVYPTRDTGRQSSGRPTPDPYLADIILAALQSGGVNPAALALTIQEAGYTRPTPITTIVELAGLGPRDILSDKDGALWSASAISDEDFTRHGPWTLERAERRTTITTEGNTP